MGIAICLPEEDICPIQRALSRSNKKSLIQNSESETVNRRKTGNTMS
jgi:hypothetical protein